MLYNLGNNIGLAPLYRIGPRSDVKVGQGQSQGSFFGRTAECGGRRLDVKQGQSQGKYFRSDGRADGRLRTKREVKTSF